MRTDTVTVKEAERIVMADKIHGITSATKGGIGIEVLRNPADPIVELAAWMDTGRNHSDIMDYAGNIRIHKHVKAERNTHLHKLNG